jgi:predicted nucleotide-binding protein (sugar kinase/HSP70/actin superfamily)
MATPLIRPDRITCIPRIGDHSFALAAAMRHHGMRAEVLPPTDDRSMAIGLRICGGRECLPCFLAMGDVIRRTEEPDFDPGRYAFYFPTAAGPCRFGQYTMLLRDILDQAGLADVPLYSPSTANSFQGFGERPGAVRRLAWQGLVAVDLLTRMLLEHRPYEVDAGSTDAVYAQQLEHITGAVAGGGGRRLVLALRTAADAFGSVAIDRSRERPVIAIVGEVYVRWNAYSNRELVREVERLGGEVMVASMAELVYFMTYRMKEVAKLSGRFRALLQGGIMDWYQTSMEHRLLSAVRHRLRRPDETPSSAVAAAIAPYYDPALGTEAVLTMGRAIEYVRAGIHGILNVLPFSCMPGIIVAGMAPRLRRDLDHVPWLDLPYDAQKETNIRTRLEAFIHQAEQCRRRSVAAGVSGPPASA